MTCIKRLVLIGFAGMAATLALTQEDAQFEAEWQRMAELGREHQTAWSLYLRLKEAANEPLPPVPIGQLPDWSGLWTHTREGVAAAQTGSFFGPGPDGSRPKLTAAATAMLEEGARRNAEAINYDENLSQCGPPGFPRWLAIPFLREFIVRPEQTWLSSETVNNVRRIYTDGRDHPPEVERYPLYYGDSIGFWDGEKLVVHTTQLMARAMGRNTLRQSDQMETVEIWENVDEHTIRAHAWFYDPSILKEAWYIQRHYARVPNDDKSLRMRYWHCGENENNAVFQTDEGSTQYADFTFTSEDDR